MGCSSFIIRNYRSSDFQRYVALHTETAELDASGRHISPTALAENLEGPGRSPETDLFVAEKHMEIIACANLTPELSIKRAVLDGLVHTRHRREGIATQLLHRAMERAKELEMRVVHVNVPETSIAAKNLLHSLGFNCVRRFLEMSLELSDIHLLDIENTSLLCRPLQCGEEDRLAQIQNRAFAETWGFNPNTTEEIAYRVNLSNCSHDHVVVACDEGKPIAYCWTLIDQEENATTGKRVGRLHMLGVDPDCRRKGIGKTTLLAGVSFLRNKGMETAILTVDSENKPARTLHESLGFRIWLTTEWYEKSLI